MKVLTSNLRPFYDIFLPDVHQNFVAVSDLINETALNKCKHGVRIINVARGGIVDEAALLDALKVCTSLYWKQIISFAHLYNKNKRRKRIYKNNLAL